MKRLLSCILLCLLIAFQTGCSKKIEIAAGISSYHSGGVSITDKGNYYDVVLDYSKSIDRKQLGVDLGKGILKVIPDYEALVDSYIAEQLPDREYDEAFWRVEDIKKQLNKDYKDEIEGIASVFSGGVNNVRGDNKISMDEFYLFNLFLDVVRNTQCSFVSVFGSRSSTGKTITGRNLDWYGGGKNQLPRIQSIITIKHPKGEVCSIGYMGFIGVLTGFNDRKVFAAVQESQTGSAYSSLGKRSYVLDLRYALENEETLENAAAFMQDSEKHYAANHLIVFSDPNESKVLENNLSGRGATEERVSRELRAFDSKLNEGVTWGIDDAIASVNSFILYGNYDNHTGYKYNTRRWKYIKKQFESRNTAMTPDDIKSIMSYCNGSPSAFTDTKYLYTKATLSMVIFQPDTFELEIYFFPRNTLNVPSKPSFQTVKVF